MIVTVQKGNGPDGEVRFTTSFTIGRSKECELQIKESAVSRRHARIDFDGGRWWARDLSERRTDPGAGSVAGECRD